MCKGKIADFFRAGVGTSGAVAPPNLLGVWGGSFASLLYCIVVSIDITIIVMYFIHVPQPKEDVQ